MEHELKKHIHNVIKESMNRKKPFWKRAGEILIEILIIVFAVSFAVYMEKEREHAHEQKEAKEFLIGLKADLQNDVKEMASDVLAYEISTKWLRSFAKIDDLPVDSIKKYSWVLINTTHLIPNKGRYEGFKSSGKVNSIEDQELRNHILDFYEERLIGLTNSTLKYIELKDQMRWVFYSKRRGRGTSSDNLRLVLKDDELNNYLISLSFAGDIIDRYKIAIQEAEAIIQIIDKKYPESQPSGKS